MNINNSEHSAPGPCKIISKYFSNNSKPQTIKDDSLLDFQEKKKNYNGPKNTQKSLNINKPKKSIKRIRGQKDIRTALHSKNELVSYTKDFDNICIQSGIDVDSEHLQLAIALSKSLQEKETNNDHSESHTEILNTHERIGKIRTTLQEYGFKVPEIKISTVNKRVKRFKKHYKLLLATEAEKQQLISDKYSQILFQNYYIGSIEKTKVIDNSNVLLYHIATNIEYESIKNNDLFYVGDLIEHNPSFVGCMLKNWSEIPGRPASPILFEPKSIKLGEIECTQNELDILLSGTIKSAKRIFKNKLNSTSQSQCIVSPNRTEENYKKKINSSLAITEIKVTSETKELINIIEHTNMESVANSKQYHSQPMLTIPQPNRSVSPDIFDDETTLVIDDTFNNIVADVTSPLDSGKVNSQLSENNATKLKSYDFMDITNCITSSSKVELHKECVGLIRNSDENSLKVHLQENKPNSQLLQNINLTKRRTDDFMEITECIVNCQPFIECNIDIRQNSDDNKKQIVTDDRNIESVDLTQSSNSNDDILPFVQISGSNSQHDSLDDTIIVDNDCHIIETIESSNCDNDKENSQILSTRKNKDYEEKTEHSFENNTKSSNDINVHMVSNNTFFEEYNYQHSESSSKEIIVTDYISKESIKDIENEDIDLTQKYDSSEDDQIITNSPQKFCDNNILGRKDNISVDYDDIVSVQNMKTVNNSGPAEEFLNTDSDINSSQNSEIFKVLDNELNYSIHRSKCEVSNGNFIVGGISVMENLSNVQNFNEFNNVNRDSDYFLPAVDIGGTKTTSLKSENYDITPSHCESDVTTVKVVQSNVATTVKTPKNSDYIIKTNDVTPMSDYRTMSTPEVQKHLHKYGLKTFKRKRAIQLLTHIYNQTHPIVEACVNEDQPSPSKKRKETNSFTTPSSTSPNKLKSPEKSTELPHNTEIDKQNNLYEVTNELPDIKDIECNADDWVFQKKEKTKVHSCRVPLHIAFHNYVTCRRTLREAILCYEPVNIDVIHKELAATGHRYDPKDLLKFMDKKCITVKTADNNKNKKHY